MNISYIKKQKAFSLVELSVTLLVIATMVSISTIGYKSFISNSKIKTNQDNIDAVYKAIGNYLVTNKKLPCPASLTLLKGDSNYGNEVRTSGACASSGGVTIVSRTCTLSTTSTTVNCDLAYGMVPTKTLGLSDNMAEDSFGTKLSYIIDTRFATLVNSGGTTGFEGSDPDATNMIQIRELSSSTILSNAIMVILSHGANKFGGFNASSASQNSNPANADELSNISTGSFDNIFIRSSNINGFDDVLLFKNKMQLAAESGFEKMACRSLPIDTVNASRYCESVSPPPSVPTLLTWGKAEYDQELRGSDSSGKACPSGCATTSPTSYTSRKCGKYGVWGPILYPCKFDNSTCTVTTANVTQTTVSAGNGTLICIGGYTGSPTYNCTSGVFIPAGEICTSTCGTTSYQVFISGSSYTLPVGSCTVKVWAIGGGGGGAGATNVDTTTGGAGGGAGVVYKTYTVTSGQVVSYSIGVSGSGGVGAGNGSSGGTTSATVNGVTITAFGGSGGQFNNGVTVSGGSYSGGDGGANGGSGIGISGDAGGPGGGAIGGVSGSIAGTDGGTGANSADVSGLFSALSSTGYTTVSGGTGSGRGSGGTANINHGGNASGFGCGGGGAGYYGGNGGNGLYGGGGGGAAGYTGTQSGGNGGNGAVVIKIN